MDKNESDIILIVRSPYHTIPDIEISCMEHWTLGMLKEHLFHVYPGNPEVNEQKIIYMGKLLQNDHLIVSRMLKEKKALESSYIIQLVCPVQCSNVCQINLLHFPIIYVANCCLTTRHLKFFSQPSVGCNNNSIESSPSCEALNVSTAPQRSPAVPIDYHQYVMAWQHHYMESVLLWQQSFAQNYANAFTRDPSSNREHVQEAQPATSVSVLSRIKHLLTATRAATLFFPGPEFLIVILAIVLFNVLGIFLLAT